MQAFFAAKSEIFFFFSEGAPPKPRAVPAARSDRPARSPLPKTMRPVRPLCRRDCPPLFKKEENCPFFVTKRGMGSLIYEDTRKERR